MTTNNNRRFEISNINTGLSMGVYLAENESDALDVYAREAGYGSFSDACEASDTDPEDIACEEVEVEAGEAEGIANDIMKAECLGDLARAINDYRLSSLTLREAADRLIDWSSLPAWGPAPSDTNGIYSWDWTRVMWMEGFEPSLQDRKLTNTVNGETIEVYSGDLRKKSVNPVIAAALDNDNGSAHNSPDHNDPAILARVAALAQKLGLKMTGEDARFFHMSQEEQVFVDDNDGLLILVSGNTVAWEALAKGDDGDDD